MNIKTRHGYETPLESDLEDYQLGWSIDDGCLYIKDPQTSNKNKVLRVLSDKALLDANQKFISQLQDSLNKYSDEEISKAKEELKSLYEKKTTYVIEFGLPAEADKEEGVDYTTDTEFDYYTKETADEAVAAFIEKLNTTNIGNQDPDIKNAGSKIIISKADHSVAYLYMILEDEYGKEYGQLINTLEQSFPSLVLEWSENKENTIDFKLNNEVLNSIDFSSMVVDEGQWSHGEAGSTNLMSKDDMEKALEYIEYVSPICFYVKKECTVRPNNPKIYDAYAYGYNSLPIRTETFTSMGPVEKTDISDDEINFIKSNGAKSIKIDQPIAEFTKRGQYYSLFRIRHAPNRWLSTASLCGQVYANNRWNINGYFGIVEYFNNKNNRWEALTNLSTSSTYNYSSLRKTSPVLSATSKDPIKINTTSILYAPTDNSDNPSLNSTNILYNIEYKQDSIPDSLAKLANSTPLSDYVTFSETTKDAIYTSDIKIPFTKAIRLDNGYDYIMLEALDLNSRSYIVPMYEDENRTKIKNQLVDILQIIEFTSVELYYSNLSTKNDAIKKSVSNFNMSIPYMNIPTTITDANKAYIRISLDNDFLTEASCTLGSGFSQSDKLINLFTPDNDINIYNNGYNSKLSKVFVNNVIYLGNTSRSNPSSNNRAAEYPYILYRDPSKAVNTNYSFIPSGYINDGLYNPRVSAVSTSNIYGFPPNFDAIRIMELGGE